MSNEIRIDGGITLVLSDEAMNQIFGGLLVSQVNNLQRQVDSLTMQVASMNAGIAAIDDSIESLQDNVGALDSKFDDLPDFDEMSGQIDELESNASVDSIGEMESDIEALQVKASKLDHDLDAVNGIFSAIVAAIHSKVLA